MENGDEKREFDISSILTSLLSNPDAISKMGDTISKYTKSDTSPPINDNSDILSENTNNIKNISEKSESASPTSPPQAEEANSLKFPEFLSILSSKNSASNPSTKNQTALLLAIKPYLSPRRQELIESFIKICQFSEILKKIT